MPTQEELLQYFSELGIDPDVANTSMDFLGNLGFGDVGIYSPYAVAQSGGQSPRGGGQRARIAAPPTFSAPPAMAAPEMSVSSQQISALRSSVQDISQMFRQMIGEVTNTNRAVQTLSQIQQSTQRQISGQQISMQYAQSINPGSFQYAPGLQYQTSPESALFRSPMQASRTQIADRPGTGFFADMLLTNKLYQDKLYHPSYSEDPYMSIRNANDRMDSRVMGAADLVGGLGFQLGGGMAAFQGIGTLSKKLDITPGKGMMRAGAYARAGGSVGLSRAAMMGAKASRFLGGPLGMADLALDLAGLPSVSGAVASGVGSVYNSTAGAYFGEYNMAKDISQATKFYTGAGASETGQGLGLGRSSKIVRGLKDLETQNYTMNMQDYSGAFMSAADSGILSASGNEEGMLKDFKSVAKNMKLFMRISGDPDYRNAIKSMSDLSRMGVNLPDLTSAGQNISNFSRMAGLSLDQGKRVGAQGSLIFQQAGANPGVGAQTAVLARGAARIAVQQGNISRGALAGYGGEEGLAQSVTESMGAFMGGPAGQVMLAGLLKKGPKGALDIDQDLVTKWKQGDLSFKDLAANSARMLNNSKSQELFLGAQPELANKMQGMLGPTGALRTMVNTIQEISSSTGMGYRGSAMTLMGADRGRAFAATYNTDTMPGIVEATTRQAHIQDYNQYMSGKPKTYIWNRASRAIKKFGRGVAEPFSRMAAASTSREQRNRNTAMGLIELEDMGSIEVEDLTAVQENLSTDILSRIAGTSFRDDFKDSRYSASFREGSAATKELTKTVNKSLLGAGAGSLSDVIMSQYGDIRKTLGADASSWDVLRPIMADALNLDLTNKGDLDKFNKKVMNTGFSDIFQNREVFQARAVQNKILNQIPEYKEAVATGDVATQQRLTSLVDAKLQKVGGQSYRGMSTRTKVLESRIQSGEIMAGLGGSPLDRFKIHFEGGMPRTEIETVLGKDILKGGVGYLEYLTASQGDLVGAEQYDKLMPFADILQDIRKSEPVSKFRDMLGAEEFQSITADVARLSLLPSGGQSDTLRESIKNRIKNKATLNGNTISDQEVGVMVGQLEASGVAASDKREGYGAEFAGMEFHKGVTGTDISEAAYTVKALKHKKAVDQLVSSGSITGAQRDALTAVSSGTATETQQRSAVFALKAAPELLSTYGASKEQVDLEAASINIAEMTSTSESTMQRLGAGQGSAQDYYSSSLTYLKNIDKNIAAQNTELHGVKMEEGRARVRTSETLLDSGQNFYNKNKPG